MKDTISKVTICLKLDGVMHWVKTDKLHSISEAIMSLELLVSRQANKGVTVSDMSVNMVIEHPDEVEVRTLVTFYSLTALHHLLVLGHALKTDPIEGVAYFPDKPPTVPVLTSDFTLNEIVIQDVEIEK